jgi:hypothetical protein
MLLLPALLLAFGRATACAQHCDSAEVSASALMLQHSLSRRYIQFI